MSRAGNGVLLPFWLALSASLTLHVAILMAPGWELPFDDEADPATLDATLAVPAPTVSKPAPVRPPPKKRLPPKAPPPATPAVPMAAVPTDPPPVAEALPAEPEPGTAVAEPATAFAVPPAPTFARQWPRRGRIVYRVTRGEEGFVVGQSEQSWTHDGETYQLQAVTETTGLAALFRPARVVQESRGTFDAAGLRPLEFATRRDDKPQGGVRFDIAQGRIFFGNGLSAAFPAATQDLLSLFYQLGAIAFDVPQFALTVATGRKVGTYTVAIGPQQELETPLGPRPARHLRITGSAREDATEIWLDADSRLPLKIRHRDRKGEIFDQIATLIELDQPEKNE